MEGSNYSLADIVAAVKGNDGGGAGLNGMEGLVWVVVLLALLGGGGIGGLGGGGGRAATSQDLELQTVTGKLDGITNGISDLGYTLAGQFAGVNSALCQGFAGVNSSIAQGFANQALAMNQGFNGVERGLVDVNNNLTQQMTALSHQVSDCCCKMETMQLQAQLDAANARVAELSTQASNDRQTVNILNSLGRYVTNPPCDPCCQPAPAPVCGCAGFRA